MRIITLIFLFLTSLLFFSCKDKPLFELLSSEYTNIHFENTITEKDTINIMDNEFVYNGGGVAVGDLNGDGLDDLYFTGNQVENKLYLNKGNLVFEDVTKISGVQKHKNQWSSGINILDINLDGKEDIYVCNTMSPESNLRKNLLFINQGNDKNQIPIFKEMAQEYGIDDNSHSSHAVFFDYDHDDDLDLFIGVNFIDTMYPNQYFTRLNDGSAATKDILYENEWDEKLGHPVFKDVSKKAGIVWAGYSHSSIVTDFNHDGWLDIYVANDYISNDLIYINNHDGTFANQAKEILKHQSKSAMGSDIGDINNDGRLDLVTTEMLPYTNKRKKLFISANNYNDYLLNEQYNYEHQYLRNTLQLNQGINPKTGLPIFSDISFMAGIQETEWSWTPLFQDFDNDGFKDLMIVNGFPKDVTDHDFGAFRGSYASSLVTKTQMNAMIPEIKVPNFVFRNNGDLTFEDKSKEWGFDIPSFSNGAAYADFDKDGDVDLVVNNIDEKAFVFRNNQQEFSKNNTEKQSNYVRIKLKGLSNNPDAINSTVQIEYDGQVQIAEILSGRGYNSKSENTLHFGLGKSKIIKKLIVNWGNSRFSVLENITANQVLEIKFETSKIINQSKINENAVFEEINPKTLDLDFQHPENDYIDFNMQRTLPHKFSQYGPSMAIGDLNNDGLDDIFFGASGRFKETAFFQTKFGKFQRKDFDFKEDENEKEEDLGVLLFDADNDLDNDIYIVRGSYQHDHGSNLYQDLLLINDGKGNFKKDILAIPKETSCGQAVKASDFDNDGDLDLFVGARVKAKAYPMPDRSFIFRNDTKEKDKPKFTDITNQICPELQNIGLVSDAIWSDFDNDGFQDLILAGEWMPVTFFKNFGGKQLKKISSNFDSKIGWWNSISGSDFDNDGDIDYVIGNFGQNTYFKCNDAEPITIYAKDFDNNGTIDPFISCFWKDTTGKKQEFFYHTRDDMIKQTVLIRKKFQTYGDFGKATVSDVFSKKELEGAKIMKANWMNTSFIENLGNGKFEMKSLPKETQFAPIYGILPHDFDQDGLVDILMVGNDYGMELLQGRADAFNGLALKNFGNNQFKPLNLDKSHFFVPHDARSLSRIIISDSKELILAAQNRDSLKVFELHFTPKKMIRIKPHEIKAKIILKNGKSRVQEFYYGTSFLSQEPRNIGFDASMKEIIFFDRKNKITRIEKM